MDTLKINFLLLLCLFIAQGIAQVSIGPQVGLDAFNLNVTNSAVHFDKAFGQKDYVVDNIFLGFIGEYRLPNNSYYFDFKFTKKHLKVKDSSLNPTTDLFFRYFSNSLGIKYPVFSQLSILGGCEFNVVDKIEVKRFYFSSMRERLQDRTYLLGGRIGMTFELNRFMLGTYFSRNFNIGDGNIFSNSNSFNVFFCYKVYYPKG